MYFMSKFGDTTELDTEVKKVSHFITFLGTHFLSLYFVIV